MSQWDKPQKLDGMDYVFGPKIGIGKLLPKWEEIPEEFKIGNSKWPNVVNDWFFRGVKVTKVVMKNGVDRKLAIKHLSTIMRSWELKHEHKCAGVGYLMSLWYEEFEYVRR